MMQNSDLLLEKSEKEIIVNFDLAFFDFQNFLLNLCTTYIRTYLVTFALKTIIEQLEYYPFSNLF